MGDHVEGPTTMMTFGSDEPPRPKFGRHQPLFTRTPTDEEKRYYVRQWGGVPPLRVTAGMLFMLVLGFGAGYVFFP